MFGKSLVKKKKRKRKVQCHAEQVSENSKGDQRK